ncbi:hypothetical protein TWF281_004665 [Arthrobotrys megalospora]
MDHIDGPHIPITPITPTTRTAPEDDSDPPPPAANAYSVLPISPISPITPASVEYCPEKFAPVATEASPVDLPDPYDFDFDGILGLPTEIPPDLLPLPMDASELPPELMTMPNGSLGDQLMPLITDEMPSLQMPAVQEELNGASSAAWQIAEANRSLAMSVDMAARFPPEAIPVNYTVGMESNLSVPLPDEIRDEQSDPAAALPVSPVESTRTNRWARSPSSRQHPTRKQIEANNFRDRRRIEHNRRRNQLIERRAAFEAFGERIEMYLVQDVRTDCRNSGFEDLSNPWFASDFEIELKSFRDLGKSLLESENDSTADSANDLGKEVGKEVEMDSEGSGLEFLDTDFLDSDFIGVDLSTIVAADKVSEADESKSDDKSDAKEDINDDASEKPSDASTYKPSVNPGGKPSDMSKKGLRELKKWEERERARVQDRKYILRAVDRNQFKVEKLDVNSEDFVKPWGYLSVLKEIHQSKLRPALRYFLYRELDRVQCAAMRSHGLTGLADRIESLEWDIRDYMKKGEVQAAYNIRMATRDYRAGFIKLPQDGGCFLYHEGRLLGYFTADRLGPFIYPYMEQTVGPIWKEDGNQPKSLPDHYGRVFAHLVPQDAHKPGYCHIHGVQVQKGPHYHQH